MDPIEAARAKIKQYLDDANNSFGISVEGEWTGDTMDPIEEARTKIKGYLDDVITLGALVKIAHGEGDLVSAAHYRDLMRKTLADGGTFCASLVGVTPEGEPAPE